MTRKRTLHLLAVPAAAFSLVACGGGQTDGQSATGEQGEGEPITLRVTTPIGGEDHFNNTPIAAYLEAVKEASGGRIDYEFYYGGALVPPTEIGQALRDGTVDVAGYVSSYTPADHPIDTWLANIAFQGDAGAPGESMQVSAATLEWWFTHQEAYKADWLDKGVVPMLPGATPLPTYHFICNSPVTTEAEAKGKLIRTPGQAWADSVSHFGMEPVSLPGAEMYESLQRGVVDCVTNGAPSFMNPPLREVAKEYTTVGLPGIINWGLFFSKSTWDGLSEADKEILWDSLPAYLVKDVENAITMNADFVNEAEEFDVTFHEMDDSFRAALDDYQADVLANAASKAPESLPEAQTAVDDYVSLHDKWESKLTDELGLSTGQSWAEWVEEGNTLDDVDVNAYADMVMAEFLSESRPE